jgi:hypothetical protein
MSISIFPYDIQKSLSTANSGYTSIHILLRLNRGNSWLRQLRVASTLGQRHGALIWLLGEGFLEARMAVPSKLQPLRESGIEARFRRESGKDDGSIFAESKRSFC